MVEPEYGFSGADVRAIMAAAEGAAVISAAGVEDDAYGAGWNGDTAHAPSQNAVYDILSTIIADINGFPDELKTLATAEIQQLAAIGSTTISAAQWAILGGLAGTLTAAELNFLDGVTSAIQTQLDARCLESVFGTSIGTGLLLDSTTLKASAILQKYHGIDPAANVQSLLGAADYAAMRTLLNFEDGADVTDFTNVNAALAAADAAIDVNGQKITSVTDPTANQDAATKKYADDLAINADGGFANSTYTASQVIDGGAA